MTLPAVSVPAPRSQSRLRFLDAARGSVMLFVFLSHFGVAYFTPQDHRGWWLVDLGMIASPTFMLISGALVAILYRTMPGAFSDLQLKLLDRGVFLLAIGHPLIVLGCWAEMHSLRMILLTDVVALNMLLMPWLVTRTTATIRLFFGAGLLALAWIIAVAFRTSTGAEKALIEALFGALKPTVYASAFPIVPWLAVALVGTAIGDRLGTLLQKRDPALMVRTLITLGVASICVGMLAKGLFLFVLNPALSGGPWLDVVRAVTSPTQKLLPSPAYLAFYGGCGLLVVALVAVADARRRWSPLVAIAATLGQNSLFMFVLQFYVYETLIHVAVRVWGPTPLWMPLLAASVVAIAATTFQWDRLGYRRFLTVGLPQIVARLRARRSANAVLAMSRL
jgi:uncharacterized membrane protein